MSVNPGFGGQSFIPRSVDKIRAVRALLQGAGSAAPVEVDGGIDLRERRAGRGGRRRHARGRPRDLRRRPGGAIGAHAARRGDGRAAFPFARLNVDAPAARESSRAPGHRPRPRALRRNRPDGRRLLRAITWCGSKSAGPNGCARPGGPIARWRPRASGCRSSKRTANTRAAPATTMTSTCARGRGWCRPCGWRSTTTSPAAPTAQVLATGYTVHAAIDRSGRPVRLPPRVKELLS